LVGPAITALSVHAVGVHGLLLVSAALMMLSLLCILRVLDDHLQAELLQPLGGRVLAGLAEIASSPFLAMIALLIVLQSVLATFVYFEQARLVKEAALSTEARTQLFALIDLTVNLIALGLQAMVAGRLMQRLGVGITLAAVPVLLVVPLAALAAIPLLITVLLIQVISRAGGHGLLRPAREALFTAVGRESRYKAKNVLDTVVTRAGDAFGGWLHAAAGMGTSGVALAAIPASLALAWLGIRLGTRCQQQVAEAAPEAGAETAQRGAW